jgi:hypothetical protein
MDWIYEMFGEVVREVLVPALLLILLILANPRLLRHEEEEP